MKLMSVDSLGGWPPPLKIDSLSVWNNNKGHSSKATSRTTKVQDSEVRFLFFRLEIFLWSSHFPFWRGKFFKKGHLTPAGENHLIRMLLIHANEPKAGRPG
jgi:hypothetical protein